eukprot:337438-Pleurochrysis_carterae.AAC.1
MHRARARVVRARVPFAVEPARVVPSLRPPRPTCACIGRAAREPQPSSVQRPVRAPCSDRLSSS